MLCVTAPVLQTYDKPRFACKVAALPLHKAEGPDIIAFALPTVTVTGVETAEQFVPLVTVTVNVPFVLTVMF